MFRLQCYIADVLCRPWFLGWKAKLAKSAVWDGLRFVPVVRFLLFSLYCIAKPIARILDKVSRAMSMLIPLP